MMVGGQVLQNAMVTHTDDGKVYNRRQLWCVDRNGDECAVFVEDTNDARSVVPGDTCWWQGSRVYVKNDTIILKKIGFSHDPQFNLQH